MLATTATAVAERRVALVVADECGLIRPLAGPVHDGEAMEAELKTLGFDVVLEPIAICGGRVARSTIKDRLAKAK